MNRIEIEWISKNRQIYKGVALLDKTGWIVPFYLVLFAVDGSNPGNPIEVFKKEGQWTEKDPVRLSINDGYLIAEIGDAIDKNLIA